MIHRLWARWGKQLRFILVGGANTAIDFGILFLLTAVGVATVPANMASTGIALVLSFFANRSFTFHAQGSARLQAIKFVIVTLCGLWVLQPLVIVAVQALLSSVSAPLALFVGKCAATVVSLTWNYLLYDRIVFTDKTEHTDTSTPPDVSSTALDPQKDRS